MTTLQVIEARPRPEISPANLLAAEKWFKDNRDKFSRSCNFAQIREDGTVTSHIGRECHANIQYTTGVGDIACVATDIAIDRREAWFNSFVGTRNGGLDTKEDAKKWVVDWARVDAYLKWFLYESYFSPFIVNKNDIEFVKKYGIIVTADIPAALLQNIMISSRYFIEASPYSFDMFNDLTAKGVLPDMAYVVAFHTGMSCYNMMNSEPDKQYVTSLSSHRSTPLLSVAGMRNMLNDNLNSSVLGEDKNYRKYTYYNGGSQFFGSGDFIKELLTTHLSLREELSEFRRQRNAGAAYVAPNPFSSPSPKVAEGNPLRYTYTEMFECLVPFINSNNLLEI